ncbi:hypothetical protein [Treponema sp. Marseille-Q3903]|nr:hypothetical protein [Treponema sp. Marseille-Q3903]MBC6713748.1 hypothetical protein [Treponema sp. Marseille-Q3903]
MEDEAFGWKIITLSAAGGPGREIFILEDETRKKQSCFKLKGAKRP